MTAIDKAARYLAKLPLTINDPALHEVVALLSDVLAELDEQKPASSNLLTTARHYASSYLQPERDDPKLCCDAQHHADICALFSAIEREGERSSGGPDHVPAPVAAAEAQECWSRDEEDFNYQSLDDLLGTFDELKPGDIVYVGAAVTPELKSLCDADDVMEIMGERAYDIAGEHADDYPGAGEEAQRALDGLLAGWIAEHCPPNFWTVQNIKPYVLCAEDFEGFPEAPRAIAAVKEGA